LDSKASSTRPVRVRIAPSPTGWLHVGTARTALFNYLFARHAGGRFVLRIEDTDKARSKPEYERDLMEQLRWLGLEWDEGPDKPGEYGPYRQSEAEGLYAEGVQKLLESGHLYPCFCTPEELEAERKAQQAAGLPPKYSGKCRNLPPEEVEKRLKRGDRHAWRFKVPEETITFHDYVRGEVSFDMGLVGDFPVVRGDRTPLFLLANVLDDARMQISHIIRGEDHLSNTPRQILLWRALGLEVPEYAHLPLLLTSKRTKISKRDTENMPVLIGSFRKQGYLPEALVNFLALLGWNPGETEQEVFTLEELVAAFSLEKVNKSGSVFDMQKLEWLNGHYLRQLSLDELYERALPFLKEGGLAVERFDKEYVKQALKLVQERLKRLDEAAELVRFCFEAPAYDALALVPKKGTPEDTLRVLEATRRALAEAEDFSEEALETTLRALAEKLGVKAGAVLWPLRYALTGRKASPGAFEVASALGKERTLERLAHAVEQLRQAVEG